MKNLLLKKVLDMTRYVFLGVVLQMVFFSLLMASTVTNAQRKSMDDIFISISANDATLQDVFNKIEKASGLRFAYNHENLKQDSKINLQVKNRSLASVLESISKQAKLKFKRINENIHVSKLESDDQKPIEEVMSYVQSRTITGKVTSFEDNEGLPGVNVVEKGTTNGAVTNVLGEYFIQVSEGAVLVFSSVGYTQEEIEVGNRSTIDLAMTPDIQQLQELVVVGYGTQSQATVTSAISTVDGKAVEEVPTQTITAALQGKSTGVRVNQSNGSPGQQLDIRIRGGSSITQSNEPLYIVDGLQRPINDINVQDIETMTVLKDAAATAIYGARASNGVVLITTKRGKAGQTKFDFHIANGVQDFPRKLDKLTARQYIELYRPAGGSTPGQLNGNQSALGTGYNLVSNDPSNSYSLTILPSGDPVPAGYQSIEDPLNPGQTLIFQDNDWQDLLFRTAPITNMYLSATGGTEKIRYSAGVGYTDQEGVAVGSDYKRSSIRVNVDYDVNDRISFRTSTDFSYSETNQLDSDNSQMFGRFPHVGRTMKTAFPDGSRVTGREQLSLNPLLQVDLATNLERRTIGTIGVGGTVRILEGLTFDVNGNYHINNFELDEFTNSFTKESTTFFGNRPISLRSSNFRRGQIEMLLNYEKSFADVHNLTLTAGYTNLYTELGNIGVNAINRPANNITTITGAEITNSFDGFSDRRLVSQFGRLFYNYKYKYLFSAAVRRDGSSVFGSDNQFGIFPSVSLGWVLTEESFFENLNLSNIISTVKLKGSWGITGNDNVNNVYGWQGTYSPGYFYSGNPVIYPAEIPNTGLKWEETTQIDFGLELGLLKNDRIFLMFDVFQKQTDDLLFNVNLPAETGFGSVLKNVGSVKFNGYELGIEAHILDGDFKWDAGFNYSYVIDEVVRLPENNFENNRIPDSDVIGSPVGPQIRGATFIIYNEEGNPGIGGLAEGERRGNLLGYYPQYIINTDQELADYLALNIDDRADANNYVKQKGDVVWLDRNGDGVIDNNDQVVIGNSIPTSFGGFTNTFSYKGFDLTVFMDYTLGHTIVDQNRAWLNGNGNRFASPTTDVLNAWTEERGGSLPRIAFHDASQGMNYMRLSTINAYKGDFLCIRDVRLGYNFNQELLNKIRFLTSLRIYVAGNNLHYFTQYKGYNPEVGGYIQSDRSSYPVFRTFVAGVKVGF